MVLHDGATIDASPVPAGFGPRQDAHNGSFRGFIRSLSVSIAAEAAPVGAEPS